MRVICIDDNWKSQPKYDELPRPVFGDVDEVIDYLEALGPFAEAYELKRFAGNCYAVSHFAPLSDLDETIIHADKIKEDSYV